MNNERMARLLGPLALAFLVCTALGFFALPPSSSPGENASAANVVSYYSAHGTASLAGIYVIGVGLGLLVFFVSGLRIALRDTGGGHAWLPMTAFAGGLLFVAGFGVDGLIRLTLIEAAHNHRADIAPALNFLTQNDQVLVLLGLAVMAFATGACILAGSTLPRWLGVLSIIIGVLTVAGPLAFVAFLASPIWMTILGFVIGRRTTAPRTAASAEAAPAREATRFHRRHLIPRH